MALLNLLNACRTGTRALGPGLRYAIWVQGCPFRCPGCCTPEGQEVEAKLMTTTQELAADVLSRPYIEGLTISGGEPMLQAASLAQWLKEVKSERPELTAIAFTGFAIEELTCPDAQTLIAELDVLIDGRYSQDLNDGAGLRGSSNQRIHFLTPRLLPYKQEMETGKRRQDIEIHNAETLFIGIPTN